MPCAYRILCRKPALRGPAYPGHLDRPENNCNGRDAVRDHDRLHTTVAAGGEQFERAAAVGVGVVMGIRVGMSTS